MVGRHGKRKEIMKDELVARGLFQQFDLWIDLYKLMSDEQKLDVLIYIEEVLIKQKELFIVEEDDDYIQYRFESSLISHCVCYITKIKKNRFFYYVKCDGLVKSRNYDLMFHPYDKEIESCFNEFYSVIMHFVIQKLSRYE